MKKSIRDKQKLILKILLSCHQFSVMMVKIHRKRSSKLKVEGVSRILFVETAEVINIIVIVLYCLWRQESFQSEKIDSFWRRSNRCSEFRGLTKPKFSQRSSGKKKHSRNFEQKWKQDTVNKWFRGRGQSWGRTEGLKWREQSTVYGKLVHPRWNPSHQQV